MLAFLALKLNHKTVRCQPCQAVDCDINASSRIDLDKAFETEAFSRRLTSILYIEHRSSSKLAVLNHR